MAPLPSTKRSQLPDRAFAYIDGTGRRRLPIHDAPHVRNALARFNQVVFEDEEARERARTRLLRAANKHGILPIGFISGQLAWRGARRLPSGFVTSCWPMSRAPRHWFSSSATIMHRCWLIFADSCAPPSG